MQDAYPKREPHLEERRGTGLSVSVVVPCYNAEHHLRRTIDSLLHQESLPDEILVVDDGSTDDTGGVARSYGGLVKLVSQENAGAAAARYCGVVHAAGDIIVFIDAGDTARPCKVRLLKAALEDNPECVCAFGVAWNTSKEQPSVSKVTLKPFDNSYTVIDDPFKFMLPHYWPVVAGLDIAIRRDVALQSADIPQFYQAGNDYAVQIKTACTGPFVHVASITSEFTFLAEGLSNRHGLSLQIGYALCGTVEAFETRPDRGCLPMLKQRVERDLPRGLVAAYTRKRWPLFRRLLKIQAAYGSSGTLPRHLWWALKNAHYGNELEQSRFLGVLVRLLLSVSRGAQ